MICIYKHDEKKIRCPRLGHPVTFQYCRTVQDNLPCRRVLDCWHEIFDVRAYIQGFYSEDEIDMFLAPPEPKINQILELINKARARQDRTAENREHNEEKV